MNGLFVRGECSRCGALQHGELGDSCPVNLFLTVPGRGAFAGTVWQAELICKNSQLCAERLAARVREAGQ